MKQRSLLFALIICCAAPAATTRAHVLLPGIEPDLESPATEIASASSPMAQPAVAKASELKAAGVHTSPAAALITSDAPLDPGFCRNGRFFFLRMSYLFRRSF